MATLSEICDAVADTLSTIPDLTAKATIPGQIVGDTVIVEPASADFAVAMGRGTDTWALTLTVVTTLADLAAAQDRLKEYVSGSGDRSVRQAIFNRRDLGLPATDAHVPALTGYGGTYEIGGQQHLSASLTLIVHTRGTP